MNKYRVSSARAQWWNYAETGAYFVTICTEKQECFFGDIIKKEFFTSELGEIAGNFLAKIPEQFPYTELGPTVVMPNHVHAIVVINNPANQRSIASDQRIAVTELPGKGGFAGIKNPMLNDNLSRVIRWYKGVCSFHMRKIHADFAWQPRFHDIIISNDDEFQMMHNYIATNIANWTKDKFFRRNGI